MKKPVQYRLEYLGLRLLEGLVRLLPEGLLEPLGTRLARLFFYRFAYRRKAALENLAIAFPEKSVADREAIAFASTRHFVMVALEYFRMGGWSTARLLERTELINPERDRPFLEGRDGEPVIFITGHFGSWEVAAARVAASFSGVANAVLKRQRNPLVDARIVQMRRRWRLEPMYADGAVRKGIRALRAGEWIGLVNDQDGGRGGIFVPFFGKMASTMVGGAAMHLKTGAPLVFMAALRTGTLQYRIVLERVTVPPLQGDAAEQMRIVTAAFTEVLERWVRQYPEQYLWMHRRWRTPYRPGDTSGG